jgi:sec-independent protein translocase protein TatC
MADQDETPDTEEGESGGKAMGFLDHLEDLRWTLVKSVATFGVFVALIAYFLKDVALILKGPLIDASKSYPELNSGLITNSPISVFTVIIQVCLLGGFLMSLPFILYYVGQFVTPALTSKEKRIVLPVALSSILLFVGGATFSYMFIVPSALKVSMELNTLLGFQNLWSADRYYSMVVWLVLGLGAVFEFPLIILILVYLGIVDVAKLKKSRKIMVVVFFIVAAIVTPTPDFITQTLVALPLLVL